MAREAPDKQSLSSGPKDQAYAPYRWPGDVSEESVGWGPNGLDFRLMRGVLSKRLGYLRGKCLRLYGGGEGRYFRRRRGSRPDNPTKVLH